MLSVTGFWQREMDLTAEQVLALAPDAAAAAAGKKLGDQKHWKNRGRNAAALWGECQGSALYQTKVDLTEFAYGCSCPSRKLPCKHVLGLLLLTVHSPATGTEDAPPEWITSWLEKRSATQRRKEEKQSQPAKPVDTAAQAKRSEKRTSNVADGIEQLDLWLNDLIRQGLAGLELKSPSFWEEQARRLIDAQAKGLANRVRRLAEIPGSSSDWPRQLLTELGRLALLTQAFRRLEALDAPLQHEVRQLIGWTVSQDELTAHGDTLTDRWLVLSQSLEEEDRIQVQRSWLCGETTGQSALILQFAFGGTGFTDSIIPGTVLEAELLFYPGASRQRAHIRNRQGDVTRIQQPPSGWTVEQLLQHSAETLARHPWLERQVCILKDVHLIPQANPWRAQDAAGAGLPLKGDAHWKWLALTGGQPATLAAIWDGVSLSPCGVFIDGTYHLLND